ncbi:BTAD domain-containing putative transcriptional regulator [Dactylosporangium sp. CA-233914]|uniref:BTAD domain-containing putative transcriptional regulator n=1 Tax=Dactylosporangium sp. CA-233914 TaxID=3239934 RepID=UPI003D933C74
MSTHSGSTIRLLGGVGIEGGHDRIGGAKARAVLAGLALRIGHVVSYDQLIDDLWADSPPPTVRNTLQVHVSAVRRGVERADGLGLERLTGGYRLVGSREQVDWYLFQALVTQSNAWVRGGDHEAAHELLSRALGLWHGTALANIGDVPLRHRFASAMESAQVSALADRIDAGLARGYAGSLVSELLEAVQLHPLDERFAGQLMTALHQAGRRVEALGVYAEFRGRFVEEYGLEPGTRLSELHRALLVDEPPVVAASSPEAASPAPAAWGGLFVGRESELRSLAELVQAQPMVTVCGPPGVGKSRLVAEYGRAQPRRWTVVRLDGLVDGAQVEEAVATALGVGRLGRLGTVEQLRARLLGRSETLVLDNCEHLREACTALIEALRTGRPDLRVVVTSTQPLHLAGEAVLRLAPLPLVDPDRATPEELAGNAAVQLFWSRVDGAWHDGTLRPDAARVIARICRSVEGLPLAIELAGTRSSVLNAQELLGRLADQMTVLADRRADGDRHGSLRRAVSLSVSLLDAQERALFAALSCFVAPFTLAAAEAMLEPGHRAGALDLMHGLTDKSLLTVAIGEEETTFRMLEPIRQYAAQLLESDPGAAEETRQRHGAYLLSLAGAAAAQRRGPLRQRWQARLDAVQPDIDAALDWAVRTQQTDLLFRLTASVWWRWADTPRVGLRYFRRIFADPAITGSARPEAVLPALLSAAVVASYVSNPEAMRYARRALLTAEELGDTPAMMRALQHISDIAYEQGDLDEAVVTGTEAWRIALTTTDPYAQGRCRLTMAYNTLAMLRLPETIGHASQAITLFVDADDAVARAEAQLVVAEATLLDGDAQTADVLLSKALPVLSGPGAELSGARAASLLAWARQRAGRPADASALMRESFDRHLAVGHPWSAAHDLDIAAGVQALRGAHGRTAALLAAAATVRAEAGLVAVERDVAVRDKLDRACRERLGPAGLRAADAEGRWLDLRSAAEFARAIA